VKNDTVFGPHWTEQITADSLFCCYEVICVYLYSTKQCYGIWTSDLDIQSHCS